MMESSASVSNGDVGFYMDGSGWGAQANLPWLKDALNDVLDSTGVTSAVNSAFQAEAQLLAPVLNGIGQGLSDLLGIGGWGQNYTQTSFIDRTTGKTYPSMDALYKGRDIDALVAKGIPQNIATALTYADRVPQLKAMVDDYASKHNITIGDSYLSGNSYSQLAYQLYTKANPTGQAKADADARLKFLLSLAPSVSGIRDAINSYKAEGYTLSQDQLPMVQDAIKPSLEKSGYGAEWQKSKANEQMGALYTNNIEPLVRGGPLDQAGLTKLQGYLKQYNDLRKLDPTQFNDISELVATSIRPFGDITSAWLTDPAKAGEMQRLYPDISAAIAASATKRAKEVIGWYGSDLDNVIPVLQSEGIVIDDGIKKLVSDAKAQVSNPLYMANGAGKGGPTTGDTAALARTAYNTALQDYYSALFGGGPPDAVQRMYKAAKDAGTKLQAADPTAPKNLWISEPPSPPAPPAPAQPVQNPYANDTRIADYYLNSLLSSGRSPQEIVNAYTSKGYKLRADQKPIIQKSFVDYAKSGQLAAARAAARQKAATVPQPMGMTAKPPTAAPQPMQQASPVPKQTTPAPQQASQAPQQRSSSVQTMASNLGQAQNAYLSALFSGGDVAGTKTKFSSLYDQAKALNDTSMAGQLRTAGQYLAM